MAGINSSIQREYARLRDQEKSLGELTASELEQTVVWDKHFMDEHVFNVQGLPILVYSFRFFQYSLASSMIFLKGPEG